MAETELEIHAGWLLRKDPTDDQKSFLFHVRVVVEEDEQGLFGAYTVGMEDTMAAMGRTSEEAAENACLLFMDTVDDALDHNTSIAFAIGNSDYTFLTVPLSEASTIFEALQTIELETEDEPWRRIPVPVLFEPQEGAVQH